jgi:hypothetical protein
MGVHSHDYGAGYNDNNIKNSSAAVPSARCYQNYNFLQNRENFLHSHFLHFRDNFLHSWRSGSFLIVPRTFTIPRGMVRAHQPEN